MTGSGFSHLLYLIKPYDELCPNIHTFGYFLALHTIWNFTKILIWPNESRKYWNSVMICSFSHPKVIRRGDSCHEESYLPCVCPFFNVYQIKEDNLPDITTTPCQFIIETMHPSYVTQKIALTVLIRGPNGKISIAIRKYRSLFKSTRKILIARLYKYENLINPSNFYRWKKFGALWVFVLFFLCVKLKEIMWYILLFFVYGKLGSDYLMYVCGIWHDQGK